MGMPPPSHSALTPWSAQACYVLYFPTPNDPVKLGRYGIFFHSCQGGYGTLDLLPVCLMMENWKVEIEKWKFISASVACRQWEWGNVWLIFFRSWEDHVSCRSSGACGKRCRVQVHAELYQSHSNQRWPRLDAGSGRSCGNEDATVSGFHFAWQRGRWPQSI